MEYVRGYLTRILMDIGISYEDIKADVNETMADRLRFLIMWKRIFSPLRYHILRCHYAFRQSPTEIARKFGISKSKVLREIAKIKHRLKKEKLYICLGEDDKYMYYEMYDDALICEDDDCFDDELDDDCLADELDDVQ